MDLKLKNLNLSNGKDDIKILEKNFDGDKPAWLAILAGDDQETTSSILKMVVGDIDKSFVEILKKRQAIWRHEYGFIKWKRAKQEQFDKEILDLRSFLTKRIVYNVVAEWEQKLLFSNGNDWYKGGNGKLVTNEQKFSEIFRLYNRHFDEAERGNDFHGQPFNIETYTEFTTIQNGINQDLQDLFAYLEADRLAVLTRLAIKQIRSLEHESEDINLLRILATESLVLMFIATTTERLEKIQKHLSVQNPQFLQIEARDQILAQKKQQLVDQLKNKFVEEPNNPKVQKLWSELQTLMAIENNGSSKRSNHKDTTSEQKPEITGHGTSSDVPTFQLEATMIKNFAVDWGFQFRNEKEEHPLTNSQKIKDFWSFEPITVTNPDVGMIFELPQVPEQTSSETTEQVLVGNEEHQFTFGKLEPSKFETNWGDFAEQHTSGKTTVEKQETKPQESTTINNIELQPRENIPFTSDYQFSFGKIAKSNFQTQWKQFRMIMPNDYKQVERIIVKIRVQNRAL